VEVEFGVEAALDSNDGEVALGSGHHRRSLSFLLLKINF
jgi:hypothetical protein